MKKLTKDLLEANGYELRNAYIKNVSFGIKDYGWLSLSLTLEGDGWGVNQENREMICKILIRVRHEFEGSKDIWMWTGYTWEELIQQAAEELKYQTIPTTVTIIRNINVLVDGPYIESKRDISLPYMGSSNQRVIGCNKSFALRRPVLWWTPEEKKGK